MKRFDSIYDLAEYYSDQMSAVPFPEHSRKPKRVDFASNRDFGIALDTWETEWQEYLSQRKVYNQSIQKIENEFRDALLNLLGIIENPKANLLMDKAWERGHGYGLTEVAQIAEDLSELLR